MDNNALIQLGLFVTTVSGFAYTWFREGRTRQWQLADAKAMAEKVNTDAKAMAEKVNADAIALASKNYQEAAAMAAKVIADAKIIADKVHESAQKLADKVAENTTVSTDAAKGAKEAYTEANSINSKIANLQEKLVKISEHIERTDIAAVLAGKSIQEDALFNRKVKDAIEEHLKTMNGHSPLSKRKRRS